MKLSLFLLIALCFGCVPLDKKIVRMSSVSQAQPEFVIAPAPLPIQLPEFIYDVPISRLTNGVLQSSTDLVHWIDRPDCTDVLTNWNVPRIWAHPNEFYRAKWKTVP